GNPFVKPKTTIKVAKRLKQSILSSYHKDLKLLSRKLTFKHVRERVNKLEETIYNYSIDLDYKHALTLDEFKKELIEIRDIVVNDHQSLYLTEINSLINRIHLFGYNFATLDIRQDSRIHHDVFTTVIDNLLKVEHPSFPKNYHDLSEEEQIKILSNVDTNNLIDIDVFEDEMVSNTLKTIKAIKQIQQSNGELGANRYIISNNQ